MTSSAFSFLTFSCCTVFSPSHLPPILHPRSNPLWPRPDHLQAPWVTHLHSHCLVQATVPSLWDVVSSCSLKPLLLARVISEPKNCLHGDSCGAALPSGQNVRSYHIWSSFFWPQCDFSIIFCHFLHTCDSLAILNYLWFPGSIPYSIRCHFSSLTHPVSSAPSSLDGSEIWSVFQHSVYKFSPPGSFSWPASPLSLKFVLKSSSQCSHVLCIQLSEKVFLCVVVCHRLI